MARITSLDNIKTHIWCVIMAILFNQGIQQANRIMLIMCTVSIAFDQYSK